MVRRRLADLTFEHTVALLAVLGALVTIPLTVIEWDHESLTSDIVDSLIWIAFVVETGVLWRRAHRGAGSWVWVGVSAFVCVVSCPAWLIVFRHFEDLAELARLLRVARMVRLLGVGFIGFPALTRIVRPGLIYVAGLTALLVVIAGGIFTLVEPAIHHDYLRGLWLAGTTAATMSYGDITPVTPLGRVTAIVLMISGVGLISTLSGSIAAAFIGQEEASEERETRRRIAHMEKLLKERWADNDLEVRLARMEALLEGMARQRGSDRGRPDSAPAGVDRRE